MATASRSFVQTLVGAIPAEEGAALVARVGDLARITSSAGSIEVGAIALTVDAIDQLSAQLLPADQLQKLRESGTLQGEFVAPDGAGEFSVLAAATEGDRWIEVRRRGKPQPPSEETLVAELLSRSFSKDAKPAAPVSAPAARPTPPAATAVTAAPAPIPVATMQVEVAAVTEAAPEADNEPAGSNHDLEVPANLHFANDKFDADDLALPGGLLDEPVTNAAPAEAARSTQSAKPKNFGPKFAASPTISERLSAYGRVSILLPAVIVLVVGVPSIGWFYWTQHSTPAPAAVAPPPRPLLKSRRLPNAYSQALVAATPGAAVSAQNLSAAVATEPPPAPPTTHVAVAPPSTPTAAPGIGFAVQVAAVHARDEADRMLARLSRQGYSGYVVNGEGAAAGYYRVRVGAFADRQKAEEAAKKIELDEGVKPWIVKEGR